MKQIEFTIKGEIPSMKNTLRVGRGGHVYHADNAVKEYKNAFWLQLPSRFRLMVLTGSVKVSIEVYQKDHRKDAHNAQDLVFDCLQHCGLIGNDRQIEAWEGRKFIDKNNPRVVVKVEAMQ